MMDGWMVCAALYKSMDDFVLMHDEMNNTTEAKLVA